MGILGWFSEDVWKGLTFESQAVDQGGKSHALQEVRPTFGEKHWTLVMMVQPGCQLNCYRKRKNVGRKGYLCKGFRRPPESELSWLMKQLMARRTQVLAKPKALVHLCILCPGYENRELGKWKNKTNTQAVTWHVVNSLLGAFLPNSQVENRVTRGNSSIR